MALKVMSNWGDGGIVSAGATGGDTGLSGLNAYGDAINKQPYILLKSITFDTTSGTNQTIIGSYTFLASGLYKLADNLKVILLGALNTATGSGNFIIQISGTYTGNGSTPLTALAINTGVYGYADITYFSAAAAASGTFLISERTNFGTDTPTFFNDTTINPGSMQAGSFTINVIQQANSGFSGYCKMYWGTSTPWVTG